MHHYYLHIKVIANENENLPHQHQYEFGKINSNLSTQRSKDQNQPYKIIFSQEKSYANVHPIYPVIARFDTSYEI